ncbi:MAG: beta-N-acetylhexosaminidase [Clostridiales bacterium]|nr:beta-N-acetylhexosaminidase [Clostridiales bacterium]
MNLKFYGQIKDLEKGIEIFGRKFGFNVTDDGLPVRVYNTEKNIQVELEDGHASIGFNKKIHFFRALGLLVEEARNKDSFKIIEEPQFITDGAMIDCSRNGVMKVESIKKLLRTMAAMGLNALMLYTEDTYTVENQPYFGYMRGRYTYDELKECDDYADIFGIEIIPCIQTLAHLAQALKWSFANDIRDTSDILLVGNKETYEFVESMIKAASAPFRSKRIHLGMDEARNIGLGRYLDKNGYRPTLDLIKEHLRRVLEITDKYGLKPMIWSDMFSRNVNYDDNLENIVPENVQLVYWDYYHHDKKDYIYNIRKHKKFGSDPVFAGGIWTWVGMSTWYNKTFATMKQALPACKDENIKEVFATMWGDNGTEDNVAGAMLGLQFFAEEGYSKALDIEKVKRRFKFCANADYQAFMDLTLLDEPLGKYNPDYSYNPSKCLLWQDILMGLFDKHFEGIDISGYYSKLEGKMKKYKEENKEWQFVFDVPLKLCDVLKQKGDMGLRIKKYYDAKEIASLKKIAQEELPRLYESVDKLRIAHRKQWLEVYKPFGFEILDIRYGGVLARINTAKDRIIDYTEGRIAKIEELEQERLYFDGEKGPGEFKLPYCNQYRRIISASPL